MAAVVIQLFDAIPSLPKVNLACENCDCTNDVVKPMIPQWFCGEYRLYALCRRCYLLPFPTKYNLFAGWVRDAEKGSDVGGIVDAMISTYLAQCK